MVLGPGLPTTYGTLDPDDRRAAARTGEVGARDFGHVSLWRPRTPGLDLLTRTVCPQFQVQRADSLLAQLFGVTPRVQAVRSMGSLGVTDMNGGTFDRWGLTIDGGTAVRPDFGGVRSRPSVVGV